MSGVGTAGLLPACKKWRSRRASCWLTLTSFTTTWALVKCGVRNGECGMQNGLAQPMPWLAYPPKAVTARSQMVDWSGLPCEARFWDWKLGPAKAHYL